MGQPEKGKLIYTGELFYQGKSLLVNTKIARGDEEYFHCAAIDTILESTRRRLGDKGGVICFGALGFFYNLNQHGCYDYNWNVKMAYSTAAITSSYIKRS